MLPRNLSLFDAPISKGTVVRRVSIDTVLHYLKGNSVVIIDGHENIGKTVLLSQILDHEIKDSIVLFISEHQKRSITDVGIYKDLCIQILEWMGLSSDVNLNTPYTLEDFQQAISNLSYFVRRHNRTVNFIFDGLEKLNKLDSQFLGTLFLTLPFTENFKYLISTSSNEVKKYITTESERSFSVPVMDLHEANQMIPMATEDEVIVILNAFGSPDILSSISRLMEGGLSIDSIIHNTCDKAKDLFQMEWNLSVKSNVEEKLVGLIAYSHSELKTSEIAYCLGLQECEIDDYLGEIPFIRKNNNHLSLASPGFYSFVRVKLTGIKSELIDILIELHDLQRSDGRVSSDIPRYYEDKGDSKGVLTYLDDNFIGGLFDATSSISELNRTIEMGQLAASDIKNDYAYKKFSHLKSALATISKSQSSVDELECYLTEDNNSKAIELIDSTRSFEEKLQMYCLYCIHQKENKTDLHEDIVNKIDILFEKIQTKNLDPQKAIDIAADLLPVFPEKALQLINNIDSVENAGDNKSDAAFYRMSLLTLERHGEKIADDLSQIALVDDKRTEMFKSVEIFSPDAPFTKIIEYVKSIKEVGDKIFLLRSWLINNPSKPAAPYLLKELIRLSTEAIGFSIDAGLFADATKCLLFAKDNNGFDEYAKILAQLENLRTKGPTLKYCRLVLNVLFYEKNNNIQSDRLNELILYAKNIPDKSIALSALTLISSNLKRLNEADLLFVIEVDKETLFNKLLQTDAYHIDVFKDAIETEAKTNLDNALDWCSKLNNQNRRGKAVSIALNSFFSSEDKKLISINSLISIIRTIKEENFREDLYENFIDYFLAGTPSKQDSIKVLRLTNKIHNSYVKSQCLIKLIVGKIRFSTDERLDSNLVNKLKETIGTTDGLENKMHMFFLAHKCFYKHDPETAVEFKCLALDLKKNHNLAISDFSDYLYKSIDLCIRCIYHLSKYNSDTDNEVGVLLTKIDSITSFIEKARYLSRLISAFQITNNNEKAVQLIDEHLLPLMEIVKSENSKEHMICAYHALPVIARYELNIFRKIFYDVAQLYFFAKERIIGRTITYFLNGCLISDPHEPLKKRQYKLSVKDLSSMMTLINELKEDASVVYECGRFLEVIKSHKKKNLITRTLIDDFIGSIKLLFVKFPFENQIEHDGYLILLRVRLKAFDEKTESMSWDELAECARQIPNLSDKSFVLAEIAASLPDKAKHIRIKLFKESEAMIQDLSSNMEKINRYSMLCDNTNETEQKLTKSYLKKALDLCARGENSHSREARLGFIDMAHKFGDSFSSTLSTMFDDDPARKKSIHQSLVKKKSQTDFENKFVKNEVAPNDDLTQFRVKIGDSAWKNLGYLNANSKTFNRGFELLEVLRIAKNVDIGLYYKVLSFYLHYSDHVAPGKTSNEEMMRPMFEALVTNMTIVSNIFSSQTAVVSTQGEAEITNQDYMLISHGEKEKAGNLLQDWLEDTDSFELVVVDGYLKIEDLELIAHVIKRDPSISLKLVTSFEAKKNFYYRGIEDFYEGVEKFWGDNICVGDRPEFKFVFIGHGESKKFPFHDRWMFTKSKMVTIGTSLNSLGNNISQIQKLEGTKMIESLKIIEPILDKTQKVFKGERLRMSEDNF
jgi:hypothetical protein